MKYKNDKRFNSDYRDYYVSVPKRLVSGRIDTFEVTPKGNGYIHVRKTRFYVTNDSDFEILVNMGEESLVHTLYERGMTLRDIKRYLEL